MKLYFSPLACSLATRICLYEVGAEATYVEVDPKTKQTLDGHDFRAVSSLGLVPVLEVDGELFTENAAVLQLLAERYPQLGARSLRLQQWLSFIATELHKAVFAPQFDRTAPEEAKKYALSKAPARLDWLSQQLGDREHLLEGFSVADAYLFTVLNWAQVTPLDLAQWPTVRAYWKRLQKRPSVARAFEEEKLLYARELARHAAA
jgi:glutathione S-transferase